MVAKLQIEPKRRLVHACASFAIHKASAHTFGTDQRCSPMKSNVQNLRTACILQVNETRTGETYDVPYMRIDDEKLFLKRKQFDTQRPYAPWNTTQKVREPDVAVSPSPSGCSSLHCNAVPCRQTDQAHTNVKMWSPIGFSKKIECIVSIFFSSLFC